MIIILGIKTKLDKVDELKNVKHKVKLKREAKKSKN